MPRVLIAEDDYDIRRLVAVLLERDGYETTAVEDGAKAIEKIATERFDAIVLDFMMPEATGAEVIDWIEQNRPEVAQSCVIIITAAVEQRLPQSECRALLFLQQLGPSARPTHIRYVKDFIANLSRHPHREFVPPELAA